MPSLVVNKRCREIRQLKCRLALRTRRWCPRSRARRCFRHCTMARRLFDHVFGMFPHGASPTSYFSGHASARLARRRILRPMFGPTFTIVVADESPFRTRKRMVSAMRRQLSDWGLFGGPRAARSPGLSGGSLILPPRTWRCTGGAWSESPARHSSEVCVPHKAGMGEKQATEIGANMEHT